MRGPMCFLLLLVFLPTTTLAQVAAPRLDPAGPESLTNPATFTWSERSRAGGGVVLWTLASDNETLADGPGLFAQGRYAGETFAVTGEMMASKLKLSATSGGGDLDLTESTLGAAYAPHPSFALGVALESSTNKSVNQDTSSSLPLIGLGLRLAEVFYLGYAFGTETLESENGVYGRSSTQAGEQRLGFAYRDTHGGLSQRYEIAGTHKDPIRSGMFARSQENFTLLSAEWIINEVLLGVEVGSTQMTLAGPDARDKGGTDVWNLHGGWAPESGPAVTLILRQGINYSQGPLKLVTTIYALGAAWHF